MYTSKPDEGGQRNRGSFDSKISACVNEQLNTVSKTAVVFLWKNDFQKNNG